MVHIQVEIDGLFFFFPRSIFNDPNFLLLFHSLYHLKHIQFYPIDGTKLALLISCIEANIYIDNIVHKIIWKS
jgi:hypothetical protein